MTGLYAPHSFPWTLLPTLFSSLLSPALPCSYFILAVLPKCISPCLSFFSPSFLSFHSPYICLAHPFFSSKFLLPSVLHPGHVILEEGDMEEYCVCVYVCVCVCVRKRESLSRVPLFATPWTIAHQALLSMGFSRQEYWSG